VEQVVRRDKGGTIEVLFDVGASRFLIERALRRHLSGPIEDSFGNHAQVVRLDRSGFATGYQTGERVDVDAEHVLAGHDALDADRTGTGHRIGDDVVCGMVLQQFLD